MKILALDIGDRWIGSALSDPIGFFASPYQTVELPKLNTFLTDTIAKEEIQTIIIGYPKTLRGTESEQTKKVVAHAERLKAAFPEINFVLWDERLSSQQAAKLKQAKTKEDKLKSHSIAAAFILMTYLDFLNMQKMMQ